MSASASAETPVNVAQAAQISALQAQVAVLQSTAASIQSKVATIQATSTSQSSSPAALQSQSTATQATETAQSASVAALQSQVTLIASNPALAIGPFVTVDANPENGVNGPNVVFHGVNIHIVSGSGRTDDNGSPTGLGNLIVGYDEVPAGLLPGGRGASHNLVIGRWNQFPTDAFGCIIGGESNNATGDGCFVLGNSNTVNGECTSILGGLSNSANDTYSVVCGGRFNQSLGSMNVVVGGSGNIENRLLTGGGVSVIVGGQVKYGHIGLFRYPRGNRHNKFHQQFINSFADS